MLVRSLFSCRRGKNWSTIRWYNVERRVLRVQHLISTATKDGRWRTIRHFQKILVRSSFSRLKSVRQVTQEDSLRFIPGSDGEVMLSSRKKLRSASTAMNPSKHVRLRRVYFFTTGGLYRSRLVPGISERIDQFSWNLAIVPVIEVIDKSFLYVVRQRSNIEDYLLQIKNSLSLSYNIAWVSTLRFDSFQVSVSRSWILQNVPMDKHLCRWWQKNDFLGLI